jgi:hypothetical protein
MSQESKNNSKQTDDPIYYVENVDGTDFTFYLSLEHNKSLLPEDPRKSQSRKLDVVKVSSLLTKGDLRNKGQNLLDKLKRASGTAWKTLARSFSKELRNEIKSKGQTEETKAILIQKILKELNNLIATGDIAALLADSKDDLNATEHKLIDKLSVPGRRAYINRKKFNKHFPEVIKPSQSQRLSMSGRALICSSYQGELLSISFRKKSSESSYKPHEGKPGDHPLSIKQYCDELYKAIFEFEGAKDVTKRGLLVITGATNSAKSEIATGLIYMYLEKQKKDSKRRPHLVTFEDPIEKFYETGGSSRASNFSVDMPAAKDGIDYTPREKVKDVKSLKETLEDALRQTPSVLFVGETRDKLDWRRLVDFAGTGHLIVTTAHAGSLTESMHKIFEALRVKTPAERSEIANRLLGIVHIKHHDDTKVLIPAVWRRTQTGKNALTAEGLSSLLPYKPKKDKDVAEKGCLGRAWFAEKFAGKLGAEKKSALEKTTIAWDLEGV